MEVRKPKPNLPSWASEPFSSFDRRVNDLSRVLAASSAGLTAIAGMPNLHQALAGYGPKIEAIVRRYAAPIFRKNEGCTGLSSARVDLRKDFCILHAHAVVSLWGSLEVLIEDFAVAWLLHNPKALENNAFKKVKISLTEYESLDKEGRMRILFQELQREAGGRQGIDRFEQILANLDLSGAVRRSDKTTLFEMYHVRNTLVHRAAHADERLVKNCPWLNLKVRDPIKVSRLQYTSDIKGPYVNTRLCLWSASQNTLTSNRNSEIRHNTNRPCRWPKSVSTLGDNSSFPPFLIAVFFFFFKQSNRAEHRPKLRGREPAGRV